MIRINLLPHREEKRRERRRQFFVTAGLMIALGAAIGFLVHTLIAGEIAKQEARNAIFSGEIAKLNEEIAEIKNLREQINALVARKQVIESLQHNRAVSVRLFNQLIRGVPDGIYLKSIKQTGPVVTLNGLAQSNSRVSHLMRNLEQSDLLEMPGLVEVKAATVGSRRMSEFTLNIRVVQPNTEETREVVR